MKQYIIYIGIGFILAFTSCEREVFVEWPTDSDVLSEGSFVVDYSGEVTTRAIKDNATKGERINSLTYLLYQWSIDENGKGEGVLLKSREIPGLNGSDEKWPLTRENMSWEQREALKDTLSVGGEYRAVFIANIARGLWNDERYLKDSTSYSTAYLQLPAEPFADNNMFYLSTAEIDGTMATREEPVNCPIVLKRVVTRTDWWFERLPEFEGDESGAWKNEEKVKSYSTNMLQPVLGSCWQSISTSINDETIVFLDALIKYFEEIGKNPDDQTGDLLEPYKTYVAKLKEKKNLPENYANEQLNDHVDKFLEKLRSLSLDNDGVKTAWQNSWRKDKFACLNYSKNTRAGRIYFDRTAKNGDETADKSSKILIDGSKEDKGYNYDGFHFVGLANLELNSVETIVFFDSEETETVSETLNVPTDVQKTGQGINEWYRMMYRPLAKISLKDGWTEKETLPITCDLKTALSFEDEATTDPEPPAPTTGSATGNPEDSTVEAGDDTTDNNTDDETSTEPDSLVKAIEEALKTDGLKKYGKILDEITLKINLPDLSDEMVLGIEPSWEMKKE